MKNLSPLVFILAILCLLSPDKLMFAVASIVLLYVMKNGWRENEPKIIFLGVISYWLTVCTLMLYGIFLNKPMIELTLTPGTFIYTTYLALIATFCYCSGIFVALKNVVVPKVPLLFEELSTYDAKR